MTLDQIRQAIRWQSTPWAKHFNDQELGDALRRAKGDLQLDAYVLIPTQMRPGLVAKAAVRLNELDPARMAQGIDGATPHDAQAD